MNSGTFISELVRTMDIGNGVYQEIDREDNTLIDIRYKGNIHFILKMINDYGWYYVERNSETVSSIYRLNTDKMDKKVFDKIQHLLAEIDRGDYDHKKTESERVSDIINEKHLTSYMNDTKWKEFLHAMTEEISILPPYAYRTLFDDGRNDDFFNNEYDKESFNWYYFKSIEWLKVKPIFCEYIYQGRLMDDKKIWHDVETEFCNLMNKYAIPYIKEGECYTIYGYR